MESPYQQEHAGILRPGAAPAEKDAILPPVRILPFESPQQEDVSLFESEYNQDGRLEAQEARDSRDRLIKEDEIRDEREEMTRRTERRREEAVDDAHEKIIASFANTQLTPAERSDALFPFAARQTQAHDSPLARIIAEVADSVMVSARAENSGRAVTLHIKPDVLPQTDVHLQFDAGKLQVEFRSADAMASGFLAANTRAMESKLSERLGGITVSVSANQAWKES